MATIYDGIDTMVRPTISVSRKEQEFLDFLSSKNIKNFIKLIKKNKKDYFNTPVPGLNILLLHHALEKINQGDKDSFYKDLLKISLYKTKESSIEKYFYEKYSDSLFNVALKIGNKYQDYAIFINLSQRFKNLFENKDVSKYFYQSRIQNIGNNKSDLLFFFQSPFFYKRFIDTDLSLYSYFFNKCEEYSFDEIKKIAAINTSDLFKDTYFYISWKESFNKELETWMQYNFENIYVSPKAKEKAFLFIKEKYLQNKDNNELDTKLTFIGKVLNPLIEKEVIQNSLISTEIQIAENPVKKRL